MTAKEKFIIFTLAAAQFANIMDFMILMPLGPQLMRIFAISAEQFSWLVGSYTLSAGISGFFITFVADRLDRKKLFLYMFGGFIVGTFSCAMAPNFYLLLTARILTGIFGGVIGSVVMAIVSDIVPMQRRGQAMGLVTTSFSLASVFGVPFGLFLANQFSWHAPFIFLVIFSLPVLIFISLKVPKIDGHLDQQRGHVLDAVLVIFKNKNQMFALLFSSLVMFSHFIIIPFLSPSMVANVGFSEKDLTWIYFLGGAVSIVSGPWVGKLADKWGKKHLFTLGIFLACIPIVLITNLGPTPLPQALAITCMFFVLAGGRIIPAMAIVSGTVTSKNRGSFMSLQSSFQQLSISLASILAGLMVYKGPEGHLHNYSAVGYTSVAIGILTVLMVYRIRVIDELAEGLIHE